MIENIKKAWQAGDATGRLVVVGFMLLAPVVLVVWLTADTTETPQEVEQRTQQVQKALDNADEYTQEKRQARARFEREKEKAQQYLVEQGIGGNVLVFDKPDDILEHFYKRVRTSTLYKETLVEEAILKCWDGANPDVVANVVATSFVEGMKGASVERVSDRYPITYFERRWGYVEDEVRDDVKKACVG